MAMKIGSLSVFFPAYNEEKNIASTVNQASDATIAPSAFFTLILFFLYPEADDERDYEV